MTSLDGKRVLVTGGARGIGLALARRFAKEGCSLVLTDRDEAELARAVEALGGVASGYPHDVADLDSAAVLRDRVLDAEGPVDVLVNNAGVVSGGPFSEVSLEEHVRTYQINVLGLVAVTHAFLDGLIERPEAHVVQVASASAYIGLPNGSTYASSKWAVLGFTESLRLEMANLGHSHVGVTAVCPSFVATGMFDGARPPRLTRILTPERLAERVIRAVKRNRRWAPAPALVRLLPLLRGVLPGPAFDAAGRLFGVQHSMDDWRGHRSGSS